MSMESHDYHMLETEMLADIMLSMNKMYVKQLRDLHSASKWWTSSPKLQKVDKILIFRNFLSYYLTENGGNVRFRTAIKYSWDV